VRGGSEDVGNAFVNVRLRRPHPSSIPVESLKQIDVAPWRPGSYLPLKAGITCAAKRSSCSRITA
jgi:hypothetical protein